METKTMQKIEEGLCGVLDSFAQKGINSPDDVETVKHALSGLEKICILDKMYSGQSGVYYYGNGGNSYSNGGSGNSYSNGGGGNRSYQRSYERYDQYGRMYSGNDMRSKLERMMGEASNEQERRVIQEAMQKL